MVLVSDVKWNICFARLHHRAAEVPVSSQIIPFRNLPQILIWQHVHEFSFPTIDTIDEIAA